MLLVPVKTAVDRQPLQKRCVVISLCNEQVKTSVCRINFDGSSGNVTLFGSQKVFLFWKFLRVVCILTFASIPLSTKLLFVDCERAFAFSPSTKLSLCSA